MRAWLVTVSALLLLGLCTAAWVRSYLPEYSTVRAHRGALFVIFFGQQQAYHIDPLNNPTNQFAGLPNRLDTEGTLDWARRVEPGGEGVRWRGAGFEFIADGPWVRWGYFVIGVPFWALGAALAGAAATGASAWRRQRRWEKQGRCRACGYDLRGSAGVCPECGTAASPLE